MIRDSLHASIRSSCVQQFERYFGLRSVSVDEFSGELRLRSDHWNSTMVASYAGISMRLQIHYSIGAARSLVECMVGNSLEIRTEHLRSAMEEYCNLTVAVVKRSIERLVLNASSLSEVSDYSVGIPKTLPVFGGTSVDSLEGSEYCGWMLQSLPGIMVGTSQVVVDEQRVATNFPELEAQDGEALSEFLDILSRLPTDVCESEFSGVLQVAA